MKTLLAFLLLPMLAFGQATAGFHRLGQVLSRGQSGVYAQVVPYAKIVVTNTGTGLAGVIYSDPALTTRVPNSTVTADANGNYGYYFNLNLCLTERIGYPNGGTNILVNVCSNGGSGSATVTSFSAPAGSWPTWLVPTVTNSTTTPTLTVAANPIPLSALATQVTDTVVMNSSGSTTSPTAVLLPSGCTNGVNYSVSTHSWTCVVGGSGTVTTTGSPTAGNLSVFSGPTSITNGDLFGDVVTAGSLSSTVVKVNGGFIPLSTRALASNSLNQIVSASLQGSDLSLLTSGIVSSSPGAFFCTDSNQGATTSGCPTAMINPMTSLGDLISGGTGGTPQRLAIGSTGLAVVSAAGVPAWGVPANATSLAGGALGAAPYQSASNTTSFINSPITSGHAFFYGWQPSGSALAPLAYDLGTYLSINITGTSPIVVTTGTLGPAISCPSCSIGSGTSLSVNGGSGLGTGNLNGATPAAGAGFQNITFQVSGSSISAEVPITTSSTFGLVKPDGTTITNTSGVFSCTTATTGQFGCVKPDGTTITISGGVITAVGGGGGSSSWSGLTNPAGNLSLTMGANTSTWTWNTGTGSSDLMKLTDGVNNTGTGALWHATTASGSAAIPWQADANGVGWRVTSTGALVGFGATTHNLTLGGGTSSSGVASSMVITTDASGNGYMSENAGSISRLCTPLNGQCGVVIADTTITVATTTVNANSCSGSAFTTTMTGMLTTSTILITPNSDISATTGWSPAAGGQLYFTAWPTSNTLNYKVCNPTGTNITPGGSTTWNVSAR